jgi:hypothetical protein
MSAEILPKMFGGILDDSDNSWAEPDIPQQLLEIEDIFLGVY